MCGPVLQRRKVLDCISKIYRKLTTEGVQSSFYPTFLFSMSCTLCSPTSCVCFSVPSCQLHLVLLSLVDVIHDKNYGWLLSYFRLIPSHWITYTPRQFFVCHSICTVAALNTFREHRDMIFSHLQSLVQRKMKVPKSFRYNQNQIFFFCISFFLIHLVYDFLDFTNTLVHVPIVRLDLSFCRLFHKHVAVLFFCFS